MTNHALITGGTGFIGRVLAQQLREKGHEVTAVGRTQPDDKLQAWLKDQGVHFLLWDASHSHPPLLDRAPITQIYHLAADVVPPGSDQDTTDLISPAVRAAINIIEYGRKRSIPVVVASSTLATAHLSPVYARSAYVRTKFLIEKIAKTYRDRIRVVRFPNVSGPGQNPKAVIPTLAAQHLKGEEPTLSQGGIHKRTFLHVQDAATVLQAPLPYDWVHAEPNFKISIHKLSGLVRQQVASGLDRKLDKKLVDDCLEKHQDSRSAHAVWTYRLGDLVHDLAPKYDLSQIIFDVVQDVAGRIG
jgi:nucleoside-diphosphate-sugar epimerase